MCGIVGYIGYQNAKGVVLDGLKTLEYRGYDSAGIALLSEEKINVFKSKGRVFDLEKTLPNIFSPIGIGHTRWATHGTPSATNAHPHLSFDGQIAVVHNGVIDNFEELKEYLSNHNITLRSQTDSEVIAHLLSLEDTNNMLLALRNVGKKLKGATTFLAIKNGENKIYARRFGAALAVGLGERENLVASDALALAKYTQQAVILQDGEYAVLSPDGVEFFDDEKKIEKDAIKISHPLASTHTCHMRAEIEEIPFSLIRTYESIAKSIDFFTQNRIKKAKNICLFGCGTAYHAGLYGKNIFEKHLKIPCRCTVSSETDTSFIDENCVAFFITQSGETQDTLLALREVKKTGAFTIAVVNVPSSSISFEADKTFYLDAGAEIAVAATKSYVCQLLCLYLIAKNTSDETVKKEQISRFCDAVQNVQRQSIYDDTIKNANLFFIGKGIDYVTAKEGALKFKEITYKMTDAYQAGELKHGAIALIDDTSVAVALATNILSAPRIKATISELRSRGARTLAISSIGDVGADKTLFLPDIDDKMLYPLLCVLPLQRLALETSLSLSLDPDKPRNLAKSVTVI